MLYTFVSLTLLLSSFFKKINISLLTFIFLTLFIGTRYEIGGDWFNYLSMYDEINNEGLFNTDFSYYLINRAAEYTGLGIRGVNLFCAAIGSYTILFFLSKFPNSNLAIAIAFTYLFLVVGMGYTRQYVATGLLCIYLYHILNNNTKKALLFLIIAISFHKTAIFFIIFLIRKLNIRATVTIFIILAFFIFIFNEKINSLINLYLLNNGEIVSSLGALPRIFFHFIAALIILTYLKKKIANNNLNQVLTIYAYASISFFIIAIIKPDFTILDRLSIYFLPLQALTFSIFSYKFSKNNIELLINNFIIYIPFFTAMLIWLFWGSWSHAWLPYKSFILL